MSAENKNSIYREKIPCLNCEEFNSKIRNLKYKISTLEVQNNSAMVELLSLREELRGKQDSKFKVYPFSGGKTLNYSICPACHQANSNRASCAGKKTWFGKELCPDINHLHINCTTCKFSWMEYFVSEPTSK